jgi:hypothetical protein
VDLLERQGLGSAWDDPLVTNDDLDGGREVREFTWQAMVPVAIPNPEDREDRSQSLVLALQTYEPGGRLTAWDGGVSFLFQVTGEGESAARRYARMLVATALFDVGLHARTAEILDHKMDLILKS